MESGNGGKDFNQLSTALVVRSRVLGLEVSGGIPEGAVPNPELARTVVTRHAENEPYVMCSTFWSSLLSPTWR